MDQTAKVFSSDRAFRRACAEAHCLPSKRQAAKYLRGTGIAYRVTVLKNAKPLLSSNPGYDMDCQSR